jgi:hypothetical protein
MSVLSDWIPFFRQTAVFWVLVMSPPNNFANITEDPNRLFTPLLSYAISESVDMLSIDLIALYQRQ